MKKLTSMLLPSLGLSVGLTACAGSGAKPLGAAEARQMYVDAVARRLEGDVQGGRELMFEIAHRAPDTRAGAQARAVLSSGAQLMGTVSLLGVVAAIALPNFERYEERTEESIRELERRQLEIEEEARRLEAEAEGD